jgi:hypothetical protein
LGELQPGGARGGRMPVLDVRSQSCTNEPNLAEGQPGGAPGGGCLCWMFEANLEHLGHGAGDAILNERNAVVGIPTTHGDENGRPERSPQPGWPPHAPRIRSASQRAEISEKPNLIWGQVRSELDAILGRSNPNGDILKLFPSARSLWHGCAPGQHSILAGIRR